MINEIKTAMKKIIPRQHLALFMNFLKRTVPLIKDYPLEDGRIMSMKASMLFRNKKYVEQNRNTPLKLLLEYFQKETLKSTYFGIETWKFPIDFWIYTELVYEILPDVIIEIGNYKGGSALALAHMLDNIGKGRIIGLDINHDKIPLIVKNHPRITLITGDACASANKVKRIVKEGERVLIIEDSAHTYSNTLNVLRTFGSLVSKGSYFIVEDSICHHGLNVGPNPGPYEAIESFLKENKNFISDREKERFLVTWNPKGYLKKIR